MVGAGDVEVGLLSEGGAMPPASAVSGWFAAPCLPYV